MLHRGVEVSGEGVLDEQGGKVEGPQDQLLEVLCPLPWLVTGQHPGPRGADSGRLKDVITEVKNINPVVQLTLSWRGRL